MENDIGLYDYTSNELNKFRFVGMNDRALFRNIIVLKVTEKNLESEQR